MARFWPARRVPHRGRDISIRGGRDDPERAAEHVAIAAIEAIAILGFAALMFRLIERAEKQVFRQNRELTAINAVSTAVQGELSVEQIIDSALDVVIERTGATEASVVVFARDGAGIGLERRVVRSEHVPVQRDGRADASPGRDSAGPRHRHRRQDAAAPRPPISLEPDLLTSRDAEQHRPPAGVLGRDRAADRRSPAPRDRGPRPV